MDSHNTDAARDEAPARDTARRILNLLFILNSSATPLTTEQIVSDSDLGYGSANRASDLKKFKRDREKLAERGIHVIEVREAGSQLNEESSWAIDAETTYAAAGSITRADAEALLCAVDECLTRDEVPFRQGLLGIRRKLHRLIDPIADADEPSTPGDASERRGAEALWSAFVLKRKIRFTYLDAKGRESTRTLEVWGMFMQGGHTYFVGLDEQSRGVRTFRDDRIVRAWRPTGHYAVPPWFDIKSYLFLPFDLAAGMATPVSFALRGDCTHDEAEALTHGRGELDYSKVDSCWRWTVKARDLQAAAAFALAHHDIIVAPLSPKRLVDTWRHLIGKAVEAHV